MPDKPAVDIQVVFDDLNIFTLPNSDMPLPHSENIDAVAKILDTGFSSLDTGVCLLHFTFHNPIPISTMDMTDKNLGVRIIISLGSADLPEQIRINHAVPSPKGE